MKILFISILFNVIYLSCFSQHELQISIKTEREFKVFFDSLQGLKCKLNDSIQNFFPDDSFKGALDEKFRDSYFKLNWIEEGTRLFLNYDWSKINEIAKQTMGNQDDEFVELTLKIFGNEGELGVTSPVWMKSYYEIFAVSKMGEGIFYNTLKNISSLKEKNSLFKGEFESFRLTLMEDLLSGNFFDYEKRKVLKEFKKISRSNFISQEEKLLILERMKQVEKLNDFYHFNCKKGNCTIG